MNLQKKKADRAVGITGASSGIGAACALALDREGFRVFAGVRSEADGLHLQQQASRRLSPLILDVTDRASIQTAAQSVGHAVEGEGLAGLVNNAGIVIVGPLEILPIVDLRR
jgi:NAD(P)-dependent dehydrogenase (short-subunit alcohol dehydrogenase family)